MDYVLWTRSPRKNRRACTTQAVTILLGAFLFGSHCIGQTSAPTGEKVKQIAYVGYVFFSPSFAAVDPTHPDLYGGPHYAGYVFVRTGTQEKPKQIPNNASLPKWSPDGSRLAMLVNCDRAAQCIDIVDANGSHRVSLSRHPTKLAGESLSAINFAWAPAGDEIAYLEEGVKAWSVISTVKSDGSARKEVQRLPCLVFDGHMDWSPDGKKLAFTGCSGVSGEPSVGQSTISVADLVSGSTKVLTEGMRPLWSPDGKMLLFVKRGLTVANADGTQERNILGAEAALFGITWLPSGRGIVFAATRDTGGIAALSSTTSAPGVSHVLIKPSEIFRINPDGTGFQKLASGAGQGLSLTSPIVSPDEQTLVVSADSCLSCVLMDAALPPRRLRFIRSLGEKDPLPSVLLIDVATGAQKRLTEGSQPSVVWGQY